MAFEAEIKAGIALILEHPEACPVVTREGARKKVLAKFPYNLYYSVEPALIRIRAMAHPVQKAIAVLRDDDGPKREGREARLSSQGATQDGRASRDAP